MLHFRTIRLQSRLNRGSLKLNRVLNVFGVVRGFTRIPSSSLSACIDAWDHLRGSCGQWGTQRPPTARVKVCYQGLIWRKLYGSFKTAGVGAKSSLGERLGHTWWLAKLDTVGKLLLEREASCCLV